MASISTGQGEGGKRAVDSEIPLVPFIDLLLCCIMFLLVTAVWNQLSAINASTPGGQSQEGHDRPFTTLPLIVRVTAEGYSVGSDAGDQITIARAGDAYDAAALTEHLAARRRIAPNEDDVVVTADDGVPYAEVVAAMDTLMGAGFEDVSISGGI